MKISKLLAKPYQPYIILLLIIILALFLRLPSLGQPFWGDEILSLQIVKHYQGDLMGMINYLRAVEVHPPLYYLLLSFWTHCFGLAEAAVRSLSLVFGLATIILSYFLGKQLWRKEQAGLLSAFLVAIMPMSIMFSQEARPYIIFSFFGLLCLYQLNNYLENKQKITLLYFAIFAIIGLYLHYSFFLILIPLLSWWLLQIIINRHQHNLKHYLLTITLIFLGFLWWLPVIFYKVILGDYELMGLSRSVYYYRAVYFIESSLNQLVWTTKYKQLMSLEIFAMLLAKIAVLWAVIKLLLQKGQSFLRNFYALGFLGLTSLLIFLLSPVSASYTNIFERHIFWLSILIALGIAGIASQLKPKITAILISLLAVSFITFNARILFNQVELDLPRSQKIIADQINSYFLPGDIVLDIFSPNRSNLNYYLRSDISAHGFYPPQLLDWPQDSYASRNTLGFLENEAQARIFSVSAEAVNLKMNYLIKQTSASRIWLVYSDYEDYGVKAWLEANDWRHALFAIDHFFPLDLYVKN